MRVHIRPAPVLGTGGLVVVLAVFAGQCNPDQSPRVVDAVPFTAPAPAPALGADGPARTTPVAPTTGGAPVPSTTSPTSGNPASTSSTVPPTTAPAPVTTAPPPAPVAPAPAPAPAVVQTTTVPPVADVAQAAPPAPAPTPAPAPAPAPTEPPPPPPPPPPPAAAVSEAVAIANQHRAAAGLPPLAESGALVDAARAHAIDQATRQEMTHVGADGSNPGDRIARTGFAAGTWAENVAAGYGSATSVVDGWMGSPGHRDNIMSAAFTAVGVASAEASDGTRYWTMVLAG